jgi:sarcosine oxidase subunit gamma
MLDVVGPSARLSLRVPRAAVAHMSTGLLKLDMPINSVLTSDDRMNARLGPDEWLLIGPEDAGESMAAQVESALAGSFFSLVDVSHRHAAFRIASPHARRLLSGGCPLDLDDAAFPSGSATRTLLGKAEIVLIRPQVESAYRIECLRSFGPYVYTFLHELMREL